MPYEKGGLKPKRNTISRLPAKGERGSRLSVQKGGKKDHDSRHLTIVKGISKLEKSVTDGGLSVPTEFPEKWNASSTGGIRALGKKGEDYFSFMKRRNPKLNCHVNQICGRILGSSGEGIITEKIQHDKDYIKDPIISRKSLDHLESRLPIESEKG